MVGRVRRTRRNSPSHDFLPEAAHGETARSPNAPQQPISGGFGETALPVRKKLPHDIPCWVNDGAVFFITINCLPRGRNQLAVPANADAVEESLLHRQTLGQWWVHFLLLMPDHLHGLFSFGVESSMRRVISDWKRHLARHHGVEWQHDFFDHRIRADESLMEKWHYIRHNPVRKGLVNTPDDWPYQWQDGRARSPNAPPPDGVPDTNNGGFGETALPNKAFIP